MEALDDNEESKNQFEVYTYITDGQEYVESSLLKKWALMPVKERISNRWDARASEGEGKQAKQKLLPSTSLRVLPPEGVA